VQFDQPHAFVSCTVFRLNVHWEAEGVEPLVTARPRRCDPAGCCLTPQSLSPPPPGTPACRRPSSFPPDRCR